MVSPWSFIPVGNYAFETSPEVIVVVWHAEIVVTLALVGCATIEKSRIEIADAVVVSWSSAPPCVGDCTD